MKLRIITYNIHRAIGLDRRFRPERIITTLRNHDADIVLLQEVDRGAVRSGEMDMAKEFAEALDYPFYATGYNVSLRKGQYGNVTLSRYPISNEHNINLTVGTHKRRGCQYTAIDIVDERGATNRLDVFNLHLGLSPLERQRQSGILARSKEFTRIDPASPCIIGGDFNDWLSRLRALYIEGMSLKCATDRETRYRTRPIKTYPSITPRGGLDRIYYRGGLNFLNAISCRHKISRVASDHLPIIVDFELNTSG